MGNGGSSARTNPEKPIAGGSHPGKVFRRFPSSRYFNVGVAEVKGLRPTMEDHSCVDPSNLPDGLSFFGIFDGHASDSTARYLAMHLWQDFIQASEQPMNPENIVEACLAADERLLAIQRQSPAYLGGSTAVFAVATPVEIRRCELARSASRRVARMGAAADPRELGRTLPLEDMDEAPEMAAKGAPPSAASLGGPDPNPPPVPSNRSSSETRLQAEADPAPDTDPVGSDLPADSSSDSPGGLQGSPDAAVDADAEAKAESESEAPGADGEDGGGDENQDEDEGTDLWFDLVIGSVGDSAAILIRPDGSCQRLTGEHKPTLPGERRRIIEAGGSVIMQRVDGSLAVSRAFGDIRYKQAHGLPADRQKVIAVPEVIRVRARSGDLLLLCCDGLLEKLRPTELADFVSQRLRAWRLRAAEHKPGAPRDWGLAVELGWQLHREQQELERRTRQDHRQDELRLAHLRKQQARQLKTKGHPARPKQRSFEAADAHPNSSRRAAIVGGRGPAFAQSLPASSSAATAAAVRQQHQQILDQQQHQQERQQQQLPPNELLSPLEQEIQRIEERLRQSQLRVEAGRRRLKQHLESALPPADAADFDLAGLAAELIDYSIRSGSQDNNSAILVILGPREPIKVLPAAAGSGR